MSLRVDIVIPTWRRPEKLKRCLESIERQTHPHIRTHAVEDTDRLFAFGVWNRFLRGWDGGGDDIAPSTARPYGDLFCYLCDDVELDPGCIAAAAAVFEGCWPDLDGLVGLHQRNIAGKGGWCRSAMGVVGRAFAERFPDRQIFCPDYGRFHADSELGAYARHIGRFVYCEGASLVHYHPAHHKDEMDETHRAVRSAAEVQRDRETWNERQRRGWLWGREWGRVHGEGAEPAGGGGTARAEGAP